MADHDVEEFRQILVRHGFWRESLRLFIESAQPLFDQPGVQMNLAAPMVRTPAVAYGEPVRIVETGELWTFDSEKRAWVSLGTAASAGSATDSEGINERNQMSRGTRP